MSSQEETLEQNWETLQLTGLIGLGILWYHPGNKSIFMSKRGVRAQMDGCI